MRVRHSWEENEFPENPWDRLNKDLVGSSEQVISAESTSIVE